MTMTIQSKQKKDENDRT